MSAITYIMNRIDLYWSESMGMALLSLENDVNIENESVESVALLQQTNPLHNTSDQSFTIMRMLPIDCAAAECVEFLVYRHDVVNLDIVHINKCTELNMRDRETIAFMSAMMMFPEWDDFDRPSYAWPSLITDLIRSPKEWKSWRKCIDRYMKNGRSSKCILSQLLHHSLEKVYLFFLCLAHVGFNVDEDLSSLLNKLSRVIKLDPGCTGASMPSTPPSVRLSSPCSIGKYIHKGSGGGGGGGVEGLMKPMRFLQDHSPLSLGSTGGGGGLKRSKIGSNCSLLSLSAPKPEPKPEPVLAQSSLAWQNQLVCFQRFSIIKCNSQNSRYCIWFVSFNLIPGTRPSC
jgi:hypothetical protein